MIDKIMQNTYFAAFMLISSIILLPIFWISHSPTWMIVVAAFNFGRWGEYLLGEKSK